MSQDLPQLTELVRTVREFVDDITDRVPDKDRYHAMCASYLLAVAERELGAGAALNAAEEERLAAFCGKPVILPEAYNELAQAIRVGRHDANWDETFALVFAHVSNKVRVSKPEHLDAMHRE